MNDKIKNYEATISKIDLPISPDWTRYDLIPGALWSHSIDRNGTDTSQGK
ncbi:hypothetical protein GCM10011418_06610 [Sphingobacterium alkalisoli]|nr:hypothetical protein GCM10011418_06610 [Sphingobacterium alkalisoli]